MARAVDAEVIDRLFERLGLVYGAQWENALSASPLADVKALWLEYLTGFDVDDVAYALEHLTERMPNVIAFRDLCRGAPKAVTLLLERPKPDQRKVAAEIAKQAKILEAMSSAPKISPKARAEKIIKRHEGGEPVSYATLKWAHEVFNGFRTANE